jgi:hypothetical protein
MGRVVGVYDYTQGVCREPAAEEFGQGGGDR